MAFFLIIKGFLIQMHGWVATALIFLLVKPPWSSPGLPRASQGSSGLPRVPPGPLGSPGGPRGPKKPRKKQGSPGPSGDENLGRACGAKMFIPRGPWGSPGYPGCLVFFLLHTDVAMSSFKKSAGWRKNPSTYRIFLLRCPLSLSHVIFWTRRA